MINSEKSNLAEGIGFKPGEEIGRYEVIQRIAIGGQSIIYKCHDPALDRFVAVKQISTHLAEDKMFLDRFRTEAQILARLGAEQPEVVTIHDLLENRQGLFIVMEFVEGISLERTLTDNPAPVELKACLQILWRLCSALHTVHAAGVVHRDIKPSNIIVADGLRPMITDFGVAATSSGEASMVMGSTKYMAPELFTCGYVDGRADMYSLGFIAYEMLVGREKFNEIFADIVRDKTAEKVRWMKWHSNPKVSAPPPHEINSAVPITLSNIVLKMIAKDSEQRFEGMESLGRAIKLTFRPGAKAAAPEISVPVAAPVGGQAGAAGGASSPGRTPSEPSVFDMEDAATAPIPRRQLSLRARISMAAAAVLLLFGGLIAITMMRGQEVEDLNEKASQAWRAARDIYKSDGDYAAAEKKFLEVRRNFGTTRYNDPSQVYIHMCRTHLAIATRDWSRAQTQLDSARDLTRKIQKISEDGSPTFKWTVSIKDSIKALDSLRMHKKAFAEVMGDAEAMFAAKEYDQALSKLENEFEDGAELDDEQQRDLAAFKDKVVKTQSLRECQALLIQARKVDKSDPSAALVAWDKASAGLQSRKRYVDPLSWRQMNAEVDKVRAELMTKQGLNEIMAAVDNARQSGDQNRLRRALESAMAKPGVPAQLVKSWAVEIKEIQEKVDFAAITKLLVEGQTVAAVDALNEFIKKYPGNRKSIVVLEGLKKKLALAALIKEVDEKFDLRRYREVLPDLEKLRTQFRGERKYKDMIRTCKFELELEVFNKAEASGDLEAALASSEKLNEIWVDRYESQIAPRLMTMRAKKKVQDTLAKGRKALKAGQYKEARDEVKDLKDAYPEAADIIRQSRFLGALAKGDAAAEESNITNARAMYKIAENYAKTKEEHAKVGSRMGALGQ